jgi:hypothetical protein
MGKRLVGRSQGSGRRVLGDAAWEGLPEPMKQVFRQRPGDRCRVFHCGLLDVSLELGTSVRPTFLVTGKDSPPAFTEATDRLAQAMLSAKVECIDLEVDSTPQAFCKHPGSAAMSPYSA